MPYAIYTPSADQDLDEIWEYIAIKKRQPEEAENILREIHEKCDEYAVNPKIGQMFKEAGPEYRICRHKRWVIVYRPVESGIEVFRVVDGARDFERIF